MHLADADTATPTGGDDDSNVRDAIPEAAVPVARGNLPRFAGRDIRDYIKIVYRGTDQPTDTDAEVR